MYNQSTHHHSATIEDDIQTIKVITKVKHQLVTLLSEKINLSELADECYYELSFGNSNGGGSQVSYVIFIPDNAGKRNVCSWQSKKVRRMVKFTLAAETLAILEGAQTSTMLANVIAEVLNLGTKKPLCSVSWTKKNSEQKVMAFSHVTKQVSFVDSSVSFFYLCL